jgi:CMP-N,N'-diacetyllegionaminic acid synthase
MIEGLSVLAVIPARGGSKGVPGKNVRPVGGRPLIEWTIKAAHGSRYVDRTVLSSDDAGIIAVAQAAGCEVPFVRAAELATDEAGSVEVVVDAVQRVGPHDVVVLLQPTSPLRRSEDIDGALETLISSGAPSCVSVTEAHDHPWLTFGDEGGRLTAFCEPPPGACLRRQELPDVWVLNGAIYAVRVEALLADRRLFHPGRSASLVMPAERSVDIDTPADLDRAEALLVENRPAR